MRFLPSFDLFDDVFDDTFKPSFLSNQADFMKTDIKETADNYLIDMELPGYKKEDIALSLKDGYLHIQASKKTENEEKDSEGHIIRQERYRGSSSRSFYVSDAVSEEDIKAKFDNGELKVVVPKKDKKEIDTKSYIEIE